jgi:hypothetical protein
LLCCEGHQKEGGYDAKEGFHSRFLVF